MRIRLHAFERYSRANGPGLRAVVWVQGCSLGCVGCFNPATHSPRTGYLGDTTELVGVITELGSTIEGVTISGGEPFQQPKALLDLLVRLDGSGLGKLVFSGYTREEIASLPLSDEILGHTDLLIAGRYDHLLPAGKGMLASSNQKLHFLTDRYHPQDIAAVPRRELILKPDGTLIASGFEPWTDS